MGFSSKIKIEILTASARHCCVCHEHYGLNIEVHHIIPTEQGGKDTVENAIALCFNCHADAGHYHAKHPKGIKLSPAELREHKKKWFAIVLANEINAPSKIKTVLTFKGESDKRDFTPEFIEHVTNFTDRKVFKELVEFSKYDFRKELKFFNSKYGRFIPTSNKMKSLDDYIDFLNDCSGDKNINESMDIQPVIHKLEFSLPRGGHETKKTNLSICVIDLKLTNSGPDILENYKVYLNFENIVKADSVEKRHGLIDSTKYTYNVHFKDDYNAEFIPKSPILVQNDSVDLDRICFKTSHLKTISYINWKVLARNFMSSGRLELNINPIIEIEDHNQYVDNPEDYEAIKRIKCKYKSNKS